MRPAKDFPVIAVVFFCHDGTGRFIMDLRGAACRDEQRTWEIGGGLLHHGEEVEDAIRREVKEEYCTDILELEFLGIREVFREDNGEKTHVVSLDYKVLVDPEKVSNGEPEKLEAVDWFTTDNLPEPQHSQFPVFLEKYRDRL